MKQVAEELGVGYVVEGSVRKGGDRVRITAQLNDVATGSHILAERYDRDLADVFAVQDEITEAIVAAIEPQLYAAENFHAIRQRGDFVGAHRVLTAAAGMAGETDVAKPALQELRRAHLPAGGAGDGHRDLYRPHLPRPAAGLRGADGAAQLRQGRPR
jgi:hypothetical protein